MAERARHRGLGGPSLAEFEAIYRSQFSFVWRSLARFGIAEDEREDVAQEVFVVLHRRMADWRDRSAVRSWLYGITRRVAADHRRRRQRAAQREADFGLAAIAPPAGDADEQLARTRAKRALAAAIDQLDEDRREVFVLIEVESMSAPEVARALGLKLNTVYSRLRLARRDIVSASTAIQAQRVRAEGDLP